jgi:hypothetical protein
MGNSEAKSNWEALFNSHDIGLLFSQICTQIPVVLQATEMLQLLISKSTDSCKESNNFSKILPTASILPGLQIPESIRARAHE